MKKVMLALRILGLSMLFVLGVVLLQFLVRVHFVDAPVFKFGVAQVVIFTAVIALLVFCVYSLVFVRKIGTKFELVGFVLFAVMLVLFLFTSERIASYLLVNPLTESVTGVAPRDLNVIYPVSAIVIRLSGVIFFVSVVLFLLPSVQRYFSKKEPISSPDYSPKKSLVVLRMCGLVMMIAFALFLMLFFVGTYSMYSSIGTYIAFMIGDFFAIAAAISILISCVYSLIVIRKTDRKFGLVQFWLFAVAVFLFCLGTRSVALYSATQATFQVLFGTLQSNMTLRTPVPTIVIGLRHFIYLISGVLVLLPSAHRYFAKTKTES